MSLGAAQDLLNLCRARGLMVTTAESCTGGLIASAITDIAGSSDVFDRGFVTYSYASKVALLGVQQTTLDAVGAVSEEVARQMALGALDASLASVSIAVTGVAGPGGSEEKPEGMVCFGYAGPFGVITETVQFGALGRARVRQATVQHALTQTCHFLTK